jgi:hypothetical protein
MSYIGSTTTNTYTSSTSFKNGEFHHAVLSISGTVHTLYLDGVQVAQNTNAINIFSAYSTITNTTIGCLTDKTQAFRGFIGDFKVYNKAISDTQVSNLYLNRNLVISYPFDVSVNKYTPNNALLAYDASFVGTATITPYANIGTGALSLTNTVGSATTSYVASSPNSIPLNSSTGLSVSCWVNTLGLSNSGIMCLFDIPSGTDQKGISVDICGNNAIYSTSFSQSCVIDKLSTTTKSNMLYNGTTLSAGAYGVILLYTGYYGPTITIRRSSDNTIQNFYADISGNLGTTYFGGGTSLTTWLGTSYAYVTQWWDQTGNGNHAIQTIITLQPVYNISGKYIDFSNFTNGGNANAYFNLPNGTHPYGDSEYSYVFRYSSTTTNYALFGGGINGVDLTNCLDYEDYGIYRYNNYWYGDDNIYNVTYTKNTNTIISVKFSKSSTRTRTMYINGSSVVASISNNIRQQPNYNNFIGSDIQSRYLNGPLYYAYIVPIAISEVDRDILEATPITPYTYNTNLYIYYPFDTAVNGLSPNIASGTSVYDFSLNSFSGATITTTPPSSYPFLGSGCLSIPTLYGTQTSQPSLAYYSIVRAPNNTSVSYTFTAWFNITNMPAGGALFSTQTSLTTSAADYGGIGFWYSNQKNSIYIGAKYGSQTVYTTGLTLQNGFPTFTSATTVSPSGWYFFAMTLTTTSSTTATINTKIISANNKNITNNINNTTSLTFNSTITAPQVFYFGDVGGYLGQNTTGYYDNFQFYNSPLSQSKIMNLYYNNSTTSNTVVNNYSVNITYNFVNIAATPAAITADAVMNTFTGPYAAFVSAIGTTPNSTASSISVTNGGIYTTAATTQTFQSAVSIQTFSATTNFCMGTALPTTNRVDIFNFGGAPNTGTIYRFYITSAGVLTGAAGTGYTNPVAYSTLAVNTWYHIAVSFSINQYTLYLNGVAQTPVNITGISGFTSVGLGYSASTNITYYNYWKYFGYTLSATNISTIYASDYTTTFS